MRRGALVSAYPGVSALVPVAELVQHCRAEAAGIVVADDADERVVEAGGCRGASGVRR
jgi:hypothetical protein